MEQSATLMKDFLGVVEGVLRPRREEGVIEQEVDVRDVRKNEDQNLRRTLKSRCSCQMECRGEVEA